MFSSLFNSSVTHVGTQNSSSECALRSDVHGTTYESCPGDLLLTAVQQAKFVILKAHFAAFEVLANRAPPSSQKLKTSVRSEVDTRASNVKCQTFNLHVPHNSGVFVERLPFANCTTRRRCFCPKSHLGQFDRTHLPHDQRRGGSRPGYRGVEGLRIKMETTGTPARANGTSSAAKYAKCRERKRENRALRGGGRERGEGEAGVVDKKRLGVGNAAELIYLRNERRTR